MLNLDTHIVLFLLADTLEPAERTLLETQPWSISAIVLWEIAKLQQLGRITLDAAAPELDRFVHSVHIWPLTLDICRASTRLDIRSDPADELIAATSVVHRVPLLTRDQRLRGSSIVPLAL